MERLADWLKILEIDSQVCAEVEKRKKTEKEREEDKRKKELVDGPTVKADLTLNLPHCL